MAGHSKWANIKHRKARQDAVKGKMWSKCSRAIIIAAKNGGGDPEMNLTLRYAIEDAKAANMPKDNIEKAIKKGSGELDSGESYQEIRYEGYGPGGVAVIVDCLTDNVNRTAPEMRKIFEKGGGNLGKPGAVAFGFAPKGVIVIEADKVEEEKLMEIVLEAGAEDVADSGGAWEVTCEPTNFIPVRQALEKAGITPDSAELTMIPANTIECDEELAGKVMRLVDTLEDHDDVQNVYHNAEIDDEVMAKLA
ncbi:MAG: YebC/PmpR family DNA-binding transcriptional regulator [Phycisphaerales bacterium]|nr:MAG: YebC/PmpR family DNA-binding transcriptional regulator [Phycisphaerales bacterium]